MALEFSENARKEIAAKIEQLPDRRSALIPALYIAQREFGYISPEVMEYLAAELSLPVSEVRGVASFYTMFNKEPVGKYHIQVCQNLTCSLLGAESLISHLEKKLGIACGQTTPDGKFSISRVECLGSCGTAPVMQINDDYYENLTAEKVDEILAGLDKEAT
jgi:NADH-quinone oxidoreductase subunit E